MDKSVWQTKVGQVERRRWLILLPLAFAFIIVYFHRFSTGVVADSVSREFGITRAAELGMLSSLYFYVYAVLQLPAGIMADFWGPRRTVTVALLIAAAGTAVFGLATSVSWLYFGRFLIGLGVASIYINIVKIFAEWFRSREFGTVSGISSLVGNIGLALAATPLALMVENVGWRESFYIIAFFTCCLAAFCWLVIRNTPAALGLPSMQEIEAAEGEAAAAETGATYGVLPSIRLVVTNWYTWPPFIASTTGYSVFAAFAGVWGVPYFMQIYGMTRVEAANYVVAISVGYMTAGPLIGYCSDRFRTRCRPYTFFTALMLASWLALTLWNGGRPPVEMLYPLFFCLGMGTSGVSLALACAKEVNPPRMTGIATGLVNAGPFVGTALLQPLFGWMLDQRWQGVMEQGVKLYPQEAYQGAFWLCAGLLAAALIATLFIKETRCVNIAHQIISK